MQFPFSDSIEYHYTVGALQYLCLTHPHIQFDVTKVSQFLHCLNDAYWTTIKQILHHLQLTTSHALSLTEAQNLNLIAYFDADWARCPNDRHSTFGYYIYLGPNLISWSVKKQPTIACTSTEAEYKSTTLHLLNYV